MVLFFWWCRPPRKPFKDKVSELYTCVFMCGCSCSPSYLCFSAVVLFSNLLFKLEMHHLNFDFNSKEIFILFIWICVFGENSSCQKFCVVPLVESIANCCFDSWITHKKKRERANCIDQGNLARYAFCIPSAKNSLWASRSIFQICSFTSFYSSAIRSKTKISTR